MRSGQRPYRGFRKGETDLGLLLGGTWDSIDHYTADTLEPKIERRT